MTVAGSLLERDFEPKKHSECWMPVALNGAKAKPNIGNTTTVTVVGGGRRNVKQKTQTGETRTDLLVDAFDQP